MLQIHFRQRQTRYSVFGILKTQCWHPLIYCWRKGLHTKWYLSQSSESLIHIFEWNEDFPLPPQELCQRVWRARSGGETITISSSYDRQHWTLIRSVSNHGESPVWLTKSYNKSGLQCSFHTLIHLVYRLMSKMSFETPTKHFVPAFFSSLAGCRQSHPAQFKKWFCCQGNCGKVGKQLNSV